MIQLLTPESIDKSKKRASEEARVRVNALGREESALVLSVNLLRQDEEEHLKRKREREEPRQPALEVRKTVLEREVEVLEARKKAALEPVTELEREAKATLANARQVALSNDEVTASLAEERRALAMRDADLKTAGAASKAMSEALDRRQADLAPKEEEIARQTEKLAKERAEHSVKVAADDEAMGRRESKLATDSRIVEQESERQRERDREQDDREAGLKIRYAQLQRAEGRKTS